MTDTEDLLLQKLYSERGQATTSKVYVYLHSQKSMSLTQPVDMAD